MGIVAKMREFPCILPKYQGDLAETVSLLTASAPDCVRSAIQSLRLLRVLGPVSEMLTLSERYARSCVICVFSVYRCGANRAGVRRGFSNVQLRDPVCREFGIFKHHERARGFELTMLRRLLRHPSPVLLPGM
jgi:hypothetical protein